MFLFLLTTDETYYIPESKDEEAATVSLECNTDCPGQLTGSNIIEWNIHLFSLNYEVTVLCQKGGCVSKNEVTKLLKLENDFTVVDNTLKFNQSFVYQDALVGCVMTTPDNCITNHYWIIYNDGIY